MASKRSILITAAALALFAGGLRFLRLGAYPFAGDETATFAETDSLLRGAPEQSAHPFDRLPRMIPLAHLVHAGGYQLFGRDEFGSRVLMALLGTAGVVVVFLGLRSEGPDRRWLAVVAALLVAVWPAHLLHSQQNRFYMTAGIFSALCMLLGARAVQQRSVWWMLWACLAAVAGVLTHTLLVFAFPGLLISTVVVARVERKPLPWAMIGVVAGFGLATAVFVALYVLPLAIGWNQGGTWGYGLVRSLMASVNQLGWPTFLLAGLGAWWACQQRHPQAWYWLTWGAGWVLSGLFLPLLVTYHPDYTFPWALGAVVLAAYAVAQIAEHLYSTRRTLAFAWVGVAIAFQLPSVVSHYQDGSRPDFRTAARFVASRWQPGDRLAAVSPGLAKHYAEFDTSVISLISDNPLSDLKQAIKVPPRLWIIMYSGRGGKPADLQQWLGTNCTLELVVRERRFDYYEFVVEVFLWREA